MSDFSSSPDERRREGEGASDEKNPDEDKQDPDKSEQEEADEQAEESFPASDPPAW